MGDFNSHGKWDIRLPSILPLPTEDEIFDGEYATAQVMDMHYHINALEAEVVRLETAITTAIGRIDNLNDFGDIREVLEWALEGKE